MAEHPGALFQYAYVVEVPIDLLHSAEGVNPVRCLLLEQDGLDPLYKYLRDVVVPRLDEKKRCTAMTVAMPVLMADFAPPGSKESVFVPNVYEFSYSHETVKATRMFAKLLQETAADSRVQDIGCKISCQLSYLEVPLGDWDTKELHKIANDLQLMMNEGSKLEPHEGWSWLGKCIKMLLKDIEAIERCQNEQRFG